MPFVIGEYPHSGLASYPGFQSLEKSLRKRPAVVESDSSGEPIAFMISMSPGSEEPSTGNAAMPGAIAGCLDACQQARSLVAVLSHSDYAKTMDGQSSIGAHMRHCLDHFLCFFRGLEDEEIDYDARERNAALETDPAVFHQVIEGIAECLLSLSSADLTRRLTLRQMPAPGHEPIRVVTTVDRELLFLMSHSIHHLAVVRVLARQLGVALPENLGVAYSTVAWRKSTTGA